MITTKIEVAGDSRLLDAYVSAIEPENEFKTSRAKYEIKRGKTIIITIQAQDMTAFRAVMNSITSLLGIVSQNLKIKEVNEKNG